MNLRFMVGTLAIGAVAILGGCRAATSRPYESCIYDSDCSYSSDRCITVVYHGVSGRMCSSPCSPSISCPVGAGGAGGCVSFDSGSSYHCYQTCGTASCGFNQTCVTETGGGFSTQICLPGGGSVGTVRSYQPCSVDANCLTAGDRCIAVVRGGVTEHICSSRCTPGGVCPAGVSSTGSCVSFDTGSTFNCYASCTTVATCNSGEMCVTETGGGSSTQICLPGTGTTGTARSYQPCTVDNDCAAVTDRCIQIVYMGGVERICSSSCTPGSICPSSAGGGSGSCVSFDSGASYHCYQTCGAVACASNETCVTETGGGSSTQICLPRGSTTGVAPYAGCAGGMTCVSGTTCTNVKNGTPAIQLCTRTSCTSDADCPLDRRGGNGACVRLDGEVFNTCIERCNTQADCTYPTVEACTTHTASGAALPVNVRACLPM